MKKVKPAILAPAKSIQLHPSQIRIIKDWQHENQVDTFSEAVRLLIDKGLCDFQTKRDINIQKLAARSCTSGNH